MTEDTEEEEVEEEVTPTPKPKKKAKKKAKKVKKTEIDDSGNDDFSADVIDDDEDELPDLDNGKAEF